MKIVRHSAPSEGSTDLVDSSMFSASLGFARIDHRTVDLRHVRRLRRDI